MLWTEGVSCLRARLVTPSNKKMEVQNSTHVLHIEPYKWREIPQTSEGRSLLSISLNCLLL